MTGYNARLQLYQVHAVTEGTDALAEVTVRLNEGGKTVNGKGADTDTLVASARAYINALNKNASQAENRPWRFKCLKKDPFGDGPSGFGFRDKISEVLCFLNC